MSTGSGVMWLTPLHAVFVCGVSRASCGGQAHLRGVVMSTQRTLAEGTGAGEDPTGPIPVTAPNCHECGGGVPPGSAYCPRCGSAQTPPPQPEHGAEDPDESNPGTTPDDRFILGGGQEAGSQEVAEWSVADSRSRSWPKLLLVAAVLAVLGVASLVLWTFGQQRPEVALAKASVDNINSYFERLEGATGTSDLREVATDADESRAEIKDMVRTLDGADDTTLELRSYQKVLTGVAALRSINGNKLDKWPKGRATIERGLQFLPDDHESTSELTAEGESAITAVNRLVNNAQDKMDAWAAEADRVEQRNQGVLDQEQTLIGFRDGFLAVHSDYGDVRDEAREMDADVDGDSEEFREVMVFFDHGVDQREGLLARLDSMYVPAVMSEVHSQFRSALYDGLQAMSSASDALNSAWHCDVDMEYTCLQMDPRWANYENSSSNVTEHLASVDDRMNAVYQQQMQSLSTEAIPDKPKV